jgi:hypothetical protein
MAMFSKNIFDRYHFFLIFLLFLQFTSDSTTLTVPNFFTFRGCLAGLEQFMDKYTVSGRQVFTGELPICEYFPIKHY